MSQSPPSCPICSAPLPVEAAEGMCPACLLKMGLQAAGPDSSAPTVVPPGAPHIGSSAGALAERPGDMVGRYKLLEQIGEGGFGIVYLAQQSEPVKRLVALKIVKPGMDSREVVARFEAERQALALMDHPNIARVFDGGATATGRPYFVMELVKGLPITKYCDDAKASMSRRLELFLDVLAAVQHAHQKGIIHRDLKPSNILVSPHDGKPVVKVIDFGIAKALSLELTEKTLFTRLGTMVGTPEYMSPEQTELNALDVDTRSDLYSLGVLLYELLTGCTPLDHRKLRQAGYDEMQRIIREEEPPRPSTRVSTLGADLPLIAQHRGLDPQKLSRLLRGDLDWIVMKALEKDRARRYETANGFAEDILRHLADEPVSAGPPSQLYRLRKLVRRNKTAIIACTAVVLSLIGGIVSSLWHASQAEAARDKAREEAAAAVAARQDAETEARISEAVNVFINRDLLGSANSSQDPFGELTVRAVLDRADASIDTKFKNQPLVEAAIRMTLSYSYVSIGETIKSMKHARRSVELREAALGPDHKHTFESRRQVGNRLADLGRFPEAEAQFRSLIADEERVLGLNDPAVLIDRHRLTRTLYGRKDLADLAAERSNTFPAQVRKHPPTRMETLEARLQLLRESNRQRKFAEAEVGLRALLLDMQGHLTPNHRVVSDCRTALGIALSGQRKYAEAELQHRAILEAQKEANVGSYDFVSNGIRYNLARSLLAQKKPAEAEAVLRKELQMQELVYGPDDPYTIDGLGNLIYVLESQGKLDEARILAQRMVDGMQKAFGPLDPSTKRAIKIRDELSPKLATPPSPLIPISPTQTPPAHTPSAPPASPPPPAPPPPPPNA